ncbi:MAG: UbiA family prenyltransferase [Chthoniobacterales bacterium]|nr:UbiA family prenyltransferase [Chthoniobacterales bacterium]
MSDLPRPAATSDDSLARQEPPLCVDLDDTLLRTDLLYETFLLLLKHSPWSLALIPLWLVKGRAYVKQEAGRRVAFAVAGLPYRSDLLSYLQSEQERGRRLILVTAADESIARKVQEHLSLFSEIIASNGAINLKGTVKAQKLEERFGQGGFDYAGDSSADLAVWRLARRAVVVSNSKRFIAAVNSVAPVEKSFPKSEGRLTALIAACRPHQWAKNILVFVPVLTAHQLTNPHALLSAAGAFVAFCLLASGVYLLNDMLDLEADRAHVTKRLRPLASGRIPIPVATILCLCLLLAGLSVGYFGGVTFLAICSIYLASNIAYSTWLKRVVMLDVVVLACFYTLRLLAGGAATGIGVSDWLLAFSVFFFFGLAMVKRYSELRSLTTREGVPVAARGYLRSDLEPIGTFGVASGMISVLVLVLYVMSPEVRLLYRRPTLLLLLCPLFLYWITRLWFKANRGEVPQDPVVFALTDRTSYIAGVLAMIVLYCATI